jgi:hypothetical protein
VAPRVNSPALNRFEFAAAFRNRTFPVGRPYGYRNQYQEDVSMKINLKNGIVAGVFAASAALMIAGSASAQARRDPAAPNAVDDQTGTTVPAATPTVSPAGSTDIYGNPTGASGTTGTGTGSTTTGTGTGTTGNGTGTTGTGTDTMSPGSNGTTGTGTGSGTGTGTGTGSNGSGY